MWSARRWRNPMSMRHRHYRALDSLSAADAWLARINACFEGLAAFPLSGRERGELAEGLRSIPVHPHIVFYRVKPGIVEIMRVIHGARDLDDVTWE